MRRPTKGFIAALAAVWAFSAVAEAAPDRCDEALARAASSSAEALFDGASSCTAQQREQDSYFLLMAGQVRATSDMLMFQPRTEEAKSKAASLYGRLYYQMGGAGSLAFYADERAVAALYQRVTAWTLDAGTQHDYRASWNSEPVADMAEYGALLAEAWSMRRTQLDAYSRLARDPGYVRLDEEMQGLMRENPTGFVAGTPAAERAMQLQEAMGRTQMASLETPASTPIADRLAMIEDPANAGRVLHVGFSGRRAMRAEAFTTHEEARDSWLAKAVDPATLDAMVSKVDFARESLVVLSIGERETATGEVKLTELSVDELGWRVAASVAVQPRDCEAAEATSYPFIVARAPALTGVTGSGSGVSNFPGPCEPARKGSPADAGATD